jgi:hypothetical protein
MISIKAVTITSALLWCGAMLLVGLINLADASYGGAFLHLMSSVYPGADTSRTIGKVIVGGIYGFIDGAIAGYLFAVIYRAFMGPRASAH